MRGQFGPWLIVAGVVCLAFGGESRTSAQTEARKDFDFGTVSAQTVEVAPQFSRPGCDPVPGWCADPSDLHVRIAGKTRPPVEVTIPDFGPLIRPDMIGLRGPDRLLIKGADELSVLDVRTGEFLDRIAGFRLVESPDNRFAAYVRLTSKRERWSDDAYLLYDIDQPPLANRMLDALPDLPSRSTPATNAGIAIYPPENAAAGLYFAAQTGKEAHHLASTLLWISDHELVFADRVQDTVQLILVDVMDGISKPQVHTASLDASLADWLLRVGRTDLPELSLLARDAQSVTVSLGRPSVEPARSVSAGLTVRIAIN